MANQAIAALVVLDYDAQMSTDDAPRALSDRPYLNSKEAAHHLGVSRQWVQMRVGKVGGPPAVRRGYRLLFPRQEFLEWSKQKLVP